MTKDIAIECINITKSFSEKEKNLISIIQNKFSKHTPKKIIALDNISFKVFKGEMIGIIGLNGSGKTTLLRIISGIYSPNSGTVKVNGVMTPLLQIGVGLHEELNAKENIMIHGMLLGFTKKQMQKKITTIIKFAELEDYIDLKLKNYSSGMKARLSFSTALQIDPDILLVDEILSVGDAKFSKKSFEEFLKFKLQNKTILYTSHNTELMKKICDRIILLDHGKLVTIGQPLEIIKKYSETIVNKNTTNFQDQIPDDAFTDINNKINLVSTKKYLESSVYPLENLTSKLDKGDLTNFNSVSFNFDSEIPIDDNKFGAIVANFNGKNQFLSRMPEKQFQVKDDSFTVSIWFKTKTKSSVQTLIQYGDTINPRWEIVMNTQGQIQATIHDGLTLAFRTGKNDYADEKWHYAVLIIDGGSKIFSLFIDGVTQFVSSQYPTLSLDNQTHGLKIGARTSDGKPNQFWNGALSNFRLIKHASYDVVKNPKFILTKF